MGNRYRALRPHADVFVGDFAVDEFEHEFPSAVAEKDAIDGGWVELVPRKYRVLSDNYRFPQGEEFEDAFPMEIEQALLTGGHIERVDEQAEARLPAKSATKAEWEKAARDRGVPDDEIQNMTKDDLVARLSEADEKEAE